MPTYDYQCSTCGVAFELFQSFSEDSLTKCPTKKSGNNPEGCTSAGRGKVAKVFSAPGIAFKGSGFYKTDSRSGSSKSSDGSSGNGKESSDSGSKESKTSDTKTSTSDTKKSDTKKSDTKKSESTTKTSKD